MIAVRLPDELVRSIDALRGSVPRERWVREALTELVERQPPEKQPVR